MKNMIEITLVIIFGAAIVFATGYYLGRQGFGAGLPTSEECTVTGIKIFYNCMRNILPKGFTREALQEACGNRSWEYCCAALATARTCDSLIERVQFGEEFSKIQKWR